MTRADALKQAVVPYISDELCDDNVAGNLQAAFLCKGAAAADKGDQADQT